MAMGVICGRRKGLIASVTRIIKFGSLTTEENENYLKLLNVEAEFLNATKPGVLLSDAFKAGQAEYLKQGFDRDEWTKHHQGGPTGYLPRDFPAHEKTLHEIQIRNAIAWNPSAEGLKVEDTVITTESELEILTLDSGWPMVEIAGRSRPAIAQR